MVHSRESSIHGHGLFASQAIPAGTRVVQYVGERIDKTESLRRCEQGNYFIFSLDDDWDIDGSVPDNVARFANHSCCPNCETVIEDGEVWIIALREIGAGDEISYNYGYDLTEYRDHPCRCGSGECVGFIVAQEFFEHVRANGHAIPSP